MSQDHRKRAKKVGLPPGSLVYVGEGKTEQSKIAVIEYSRRWFKGWGSKAAGMKLESGKRPTVRWIDIEGIQDIATMTKIGSRFRIHPLVMEDILQTGQRPKLEEFDDFLFVVLKMLKFDKHAGKVESEQVSIILRKDMVLTFQEGIKGDVFDSIRNRIRLDNGHIRSSGPDYLVYSLMDAVVDQYFLILEELGERIERMEEKIVSHPTPESLREIQRMKRELMFVRQSIWSLREVMGQLVRGDSRFIRNSTLIYLRDLHDHVIAAIETLETFREILFGQIEIAMTSMSNRMNEVMKVLTIIATIFIPLTFVVGVYGMNFDASVSPWNMPELRWYFGYPLLLAFMGLIAGAMILYFKRKRWF